MSLWYNYHIMMNNNFGYYGHYNSFGFSPWGGVGFSLLGILISICVVALLVLKGYSLWTAARRGEKWWFIVLLFINTLGLLEIAYLIFVAKVLFGKHCSEGKCECENEEEKCDEEGCNSHEHHHHSHPHKHE